jgi:signal peptidase I
MTETVEVAAHAKTETPKAVNEGWEWTKAVLTALVFVLVLKTVIFQQFTIPSASMEPNLYQGDYIYVTKYSYGWSRHSILFSPPLFKGRIFGREPARGDIVVFKLPRDGRTDYIKRLIGLPGDHVQVRGGVVFVNGERIPREQTALVREDVGGGDVRTVARVRETLPSGKSYMTNDFGAGGLLDDTPEFVVPQGHYFFMGDNRDNSLDSRLDQSVGVGFVPAENLVGKAQAIVFSWQPEASLLKPWTLVTKVRPERFFKGLN